MSSNSRMFWQFCKFAFVGGCATTIHYSILALLVEVMGVDPVLATTVGFVFAATFNYSLNRRFTFESSTKHIVALPKFLTVCLLGAAINAAIVSWFVAHTTFHYFISQICATGTVLVWNFAANAIWTFRQAR